MSLEGSLTDIPLAELFQIISMANKTGSIVLHTVGASGEILLSEGKVCAVCRSTSTTTVGEILFQDGIISPEQYQEMMYFHRHQPENTDYQPPIVWQRYGIEQTVVQATLRNAVEQLIYPMFEWDGTFDYTVDDNVMDNYRLFSVNSTMIVTSDGINPQWLAMEGTRLLDEKRRDDPFDDFLQHKKELAAEQESTAISKITALAAALDDTPFETMAPEKKADPDIVPMAEEPTPVAPPTQEPIVDDALILRQTPPIVETIVHRPSVTAAIDARIEVVPPIEHIAKSKEPAAAAVESTETASSSESVESAGPVKSAEPATAVAPASTTQSTGSADSWSNAIMLPDIELGTDEHEAVSHDDSRTTPPTTTAQDRDEKADQEPQALAIPGLDIPQEVPAPIITRVSDTGTREFELPALKPNTEEPLEIPGLVQPQQAGETPKPLETKPLPVKPIPVKPIPLKPLGPVTKVKPVVVLPVKPEPAAVPVPPVEPSAPITTTDKVSVSKPALTPITAPVAPNSNKEPIELIIIDDDEIYLRQLESGLSALPATISCYKDVKAGIAAITDKNSAGLSLVVVADLIIARSDSSGILGGLEIITEVKKLNNDIPIILVTDFNNEDARKEATAQGVSLFLNKPRRGQMNSAAPSAHMEKYITQLAKILVPFCPTVTPDDTKPSSEGDEALTDSFDLRSELSDELREVGLELDANIQMTVQDEGPKEMRALRSMLAELNDPANNENIALLILRFAADLLPRAAFFMIDRDYVLGLGGFSSFACDGDSCSFVQRIKNLRVPLKDDSIFKTVVNFRIPYRGFLPKSSLNEQISTTLGPERPTEVFVAPIISGNRVAAVLYGDTTSSSGALENTQGLEIFLLQAGLAMERSLLERKLREASQH